VTELGAEAWRHYPRIDWARLARAQAFYEAKGYEYVEVPWAVPEDVVYGTMPPGATPIHVRRDAILIGSAEQGFLDMALRQRGRLSKGNLYFSISPCFRGEPSIIPGHTQLCFMKLELFAPDRDYEAEETSKHLLDDAEQFMTTEGAHLTRLRTEAGFDLECDGIEVGSYGIRQFEGVHWAYATGLAEPRFSTALHHQQERRRKWWSGR